MNFQKIYRFFIVAFLVLVFSFPRVLQEIKIVSLAILVMLLIAMGENVVKILKLFFLYLLFFITPLLIAGIYGNETEYILNGLKIYYFFPLILAMIFYATDREGLQKMIYKSAAISLFIITVISLSTLLNGLGYFPINLNALFYEDEDRIGLNEGYTHIINSSLSYYIFLIPIVFNKAESFNVKNIKLYLFVFLLIFAIITGRRILLLPFILIIIYQFKRFYKYSIAFVIAFFFFFSSNKFENFDPSMIFLRFEDALNSSGDSTLREEQTKYFEQYISERPIEGYGLGAYMKDYLRNTDFKTAYEKSYQYLVFSIGIPLTLLLFFFYLYLLYRSWKLGDSEDSLNKGIVIGFVSLLLASYTNPYWLSSFDYVIPFAMLITFSTKTLTDA